VYLEVEMWGKDNTMDLRLVALSSSLVLAAYASADIFVTSQDRNVTARGAIAGVTGSSTQSAPNFAPFAGDVNYGSGSSSSPDYAYGRATQNSSISTTLLTDSGRIEAYHGRGGGTSHFNVTFNVLATQTYDFTSSVTNGGFDFVGFDVSLTGPGGIVFSGRPFPNTPFNRTGMLEPGQYTLDALGSMGGVSTSSTISSNYSMSLSIVPAPASVSLAAAGMLAGLRRRRSGAKAN
jgi:hypothetical protein